MAKYSGVRSQKSGDGGIEWGKGRKINIFTITQSPNHPITPSPNHPITPSPHHPITPFPHHPITPSPNSLIPPSPNLPLYF
ncbi:hypothetical protein [Dapis sp. BLCC M229]|uniref:hypothetical protein n=1 Tax=Dapis sp. BLCC M229 TaxID=3400188 RepID=UPI003CF692DD